LFLRQDAADLGSLGGLQISLTNIALTGLYVAWLVRSIVQSGSFAPQRLKLNRVALPAVLFLLFCAVSLVVAGDTTLGVFGFVSVIERFLLFLYIATAITSDEDVLFIFRILLIGLVIQSSLMLAQAGGLVGDIDFYGIKARTEFAGASRISGTIGAPNMAAAYLAMMMAVALGVLLAQVRQADKYLAGTGLAMATLPLVFTSSRGGWLSFFVGLAILVIFGGRRLPRKAIGIVIVAIILLIIPFTGTIEERVFSDDNGSAAARMPLNRLAGVMIADHALLGVGVNNFALAMRPYLAHGFSGEFLYTVHNTYLLVWAESGLGGLIAFVWFLIAILRQGSKCWRSRDPLFTLPALGCSAAVIGFMVQMSFDPFRSDAANHMLWFFGGLLTAMNQLSVGRLAVPQTRIIPNRGLSH